MFFFDCRIYGSCVLGNEHMVGHDVFDRKTTETLGPRHNKIFVSSRKTKDLIYMKHYINKNVEKDVLIRDRERKIYSLISFVMPPLVFN